jgi:hypothetical protein
MEHLAFAAQNAADKDFIAYVYLSGTLDPVVLRLLKIVETRQDWQDEFTDCYDTPKDVAQELDNAKCDLRSAEEMIKEQAEEIHRLTTRTVIELLAEQEQKLKSAQAVAQSAREELWKEQHLRQTAESKLQVWDILAT